MPRWWEWLWFGVRLRQLRLHWLQALVRVRHGTHAGNHDCRGGHLHDRGCGLLGLEIQRVTGMIATVRRRDAIATRTRTRVVRHNACARAARSRRTLASAQAIRRRCAWIIARLSRAGRAHVTHRSRTAAQAGSDIAVLSCCSGGNGGRALGIPDRRRGGSRARSRRRAARGRGEACRRCRRALVHGSGGECC